MIWFFWNRKNWWFIFYCLFGLNVALQGENCGPMIQKNKYSLNDYNIYFFKIFDINNKEFIGYKDFLKISSQISLLTVPVLFDNYVLSNVQTIKNHVNGNSFLNSMTMREGSVFILNLAKTTIEQEKIKEIIKAGGFHNRLLFKVISTDFLLSNN